VHAFEQAPLDQPLDETRARVGQDGLAYDRSKALGESEIRALVARGLDAVIVHPSAVIGPFDFRPSRMGQVFLDLYRGRLPTLVEGGFDWVDVRDVVLGAVSAMERGRTGESYLLTGHWASVGELAAIAERLTGRPAPRLTSPQWLARAFAPLMEAWARWTRTEPLYTSESLAALRANRVYVRTKAERELGYSARPLIESVAEVYRWFARAGRLPAALLDRLGAAPLDACAAPSAMAPSEARAP
jgi:dihydroflavonol-4-reductase